MVENARNVANGWTMMMIVVKPMAIHGVIKNTQKTTFKQIIKWKQIQKVFFLKQSL